jgi:two-component system, OmpR family, response regulator VanR
MISLSDKNLLLLEDNKDFVDNAVSLFNIFVKKTFVATNTTEAFAYLKKENIDIIISDIKLKNENGLDFIRIVREKDDKIPIVVLSGHKDEELLFRAMTLNLSGYLLKPINFKMLTEAFEQCAKKLQDNSLNIIILKDGYSYNKELKYIIKDEEIFELNKKEILFMEMLCENKHKIITKDMLLAYVYEYNPMSDSAINNFIMRIRRRFGKTFLYTIPDVGYKLLV